MSAFKFASKLLSDESGAAAMEYALIAAFLSIMLVSGASALGLKMDIHYSTIANLLP